MKSSPLMDRRTLVKSSASGVAFFAAATISGCGRVEDRDLVAQNSVALADHTLSEDYVEMYDTYAMATYYDGSLGPKTGIIKVEDIIKNEAKAMDFWHGHGGKVHKFTVTPEHFTALVNQKKVVIETTSVESHAHKLFIDPTDPKWRVPGAKPIKVPKRSFG